MSGRFPVRSQATDWHALADRMDRLASTATAGDPAARLHDAIALLERDTQGDLARSLHRHSATGMPTREPLIWQMQKDGSGVLGIIRFLDFDRLCMFDPSLGDQLLIAVAARLRAMLPPERLLYHVDRAHIAIWFGPAESRGSSSVELGAIEYALGEAMAIGSHSIVPKICTRLSELDGEEPAIALTRTLQAELAPDNVYVQLVIAAATRTDLWPWDDRPPEPLPGVMTPQDLVDAAMVGFDLREPVTIPSLADTKGWTRYENARNALIFDLVNSEPASRYLKRD